MPVQEGNHAMKTKWVALGAVAVAIVTAVALLLIRPPLTDEVRLHRVLSTVAEATRRESPNRILSVLSEDYSDDMGNSRPSLRADLAQAFWGPRRFEVTWRHVNVTSSNEDQLVADVAFELRQYSNESVVSRHHGTVRVTFIRAGGNLKVLRVDGLRNVAESVEASYGI